MGCCCSSSTEKRITLEVEYTGSESNSAIEFIRAGRLRARICPWETFTTVEKRLEVFQWHRGISVFSEAKVFDGRFCAMRVVKAKYDLTIITAQNKLIPIARLSKLEKTPTFDVYVKFTRGGCLCGGPASAGGYAPAGKVMPANQPDAAGMREYAAVLPHLQAPVQTQVQVVTVPSPSPTATPVPSAGSNLTQLADMYQKGLLSEEEFAAAKARELGTSSPSAKVQTGEPIFEKAQDPPPF